MAGNIDHGTISITQADFGRKYIHHEVSYTLKLVDVALSLSSNMRDHSPPVLLHPNDLTCQRRKVASKCSDGVCMQLGREQEKEEASLF